MHRIAPFSLALVALVALLAAPVPAAAPQDPGEVLGQTELSGVPNVEASSRFGTSVDAVGDLDGNGAVDLVIGARFDDSAGPDRGAAFVVRLNPDGSVLASTKVVSGVGGVALDDFDYFGTAAAGIGDVNGDGVPDAAVAAAGDDDGLGGPSSNSVGALWILFLDAAGGVTGSQKISATQGGLAGPVEISDGWFSDVESLGDLDGDGVPDLAVGVQTDDDAAGGAGAVQLLFLNADGTVKAQQKITAGQGGFVGPLAVADQFGAAVAVLDDLDGNGVVDLAVGAPGDDDGAQGSFASRGAVWILFLDAGGTVIAEQKISDLAGGFEGVLLDDDRFGQNLAALGDVDGDGIEDLAVGATGDDGSAPVGGFSDFGAVWVLHLNADGTVADEVAIAEDGGGLAPGTLDLGAFFGAVAAVGDLDGDGAVDLAVGAAGQDSGTGAVFLLNLAGGAFGAPYGCGVNPAGSLVELGGSPSVGDTWTLGVLDPTGQQPPGSFALLAVASAPSPGFPCGVPLAEFGMGPGPAPGELLVSVVAPDPVKLLGPVLYTGAPAPIGVKIPDDASFAGTPFFTQGVLVDLVDGFGLTEGRQAVVLP